MYEIRYSRDVKKDLFDIRVYERKRILDNIDKQLTYEPTKKTRNRKPIYNLIPPWKNIEAIWELRVGQYRIFYDVDEKNLTVTVRAIRHKPPHKTTEEIL